MIKTSVRYCRKCKYAYKHSNTDVICGYMVQTKRAGVVRLDCAINMRKSEENEKRNQAINNGKRMVGMRNKDEELRREGMAYALKIAKEKGIAGLEEECKFRGASRLPLALPRNAIDECVNKIKMNTIDTITILSAITLRDEFEFGQKRIQKFVKRFNSKAECIMENYTTWDDQIQILREECGLEFLIRKNDTDVKVRCSHDRK